MHGYFSILNTPKHLCISTIRFISSRNDDQQVEVSTSGSLQYSATIPDKSPAKRVSVTYQ